MGRRGEGIPTWEGELDSGVLSCKVWMGRRSEEEGILTNEGGWIRVCCPVRYRWGAGQRSFLHTKERLTRVSCPVGYAWGAGQSGRTCIPQTMFGAPHVHTAWPTFKGALCA